MRQRQTGKSNRDKATTKCTTKLKPLKENTTRTARQLTFAGYLVCLGQMHSIIVGLQSTATTITTISTIESLSPLVPESMCLLLHLSATWPWRSARTSKACTCLKRPTRDINEMTKSCLWVFGLCYWWLSVPPPFLSFLFSFAPSSPLPLLFLTSSSSVRPAVVSFDLSSPDVEISTPGPCTARLRSNGQVPGMGADLAEAWESY